MNSIHRLMSQTYVTITLLCIGAVIFLACVDSDVFNVTYSTDFLQPMSATIQREKLMEVGPFKFLPNYKNPCWLNTDHDVDGSLPVRCLPFYYLVGVPKAGTTDIAKRLTNHPQISSRIQKETHWLTRKRYITGSNIKKFQDKYFSSATRQIVGQRDKNGYHNMIFGECSASTIWDNYRFSKVKAHQNLTETQYSNAHILHHLNPKTKIIVMVRNPVDRLYSEHLYFSHTSPQAFHDRVIATIQQAEACLKNHTIRHCVYKSERGHAAVFRHSRMQIGIYHVHLEEFFRVFPRDQIMVIKLEDFSVNTEKYMKALFKFLDLDAVDRDTLTRISSRNTKANTRSKKDKQFGEMFPETRKILEDFYRPFNEKLVQLLGESFNYN